MLLQGLAIGENIIKINNNKVVKEQTKYLVISVQNVPGVLVMLKGMARNSYDP